MHVLRSTPPSVQYHPPKRVMNTGMFWAFVDPHGNSLRYGDLHSYILQSDIGRWFQ